MKKMIGVLIMLLGLWPKIVMAENKGVTMSPPFAEVTIGRHELQKELVVEIGNNSASQLTMNLSVVDFGSLDESGGVAFLTAKKSTDQKYALASWMSLEKDWVVVDPGKKEKVKITILNKESLSGGGHYGAVLATIKNDQKINSDLVGLNQAVATLVYVQKSGGEIKNLIYKSSDYVKNWLWLPRIVKVRFQNSGNVHLIPRGKIEVSDWRNQIVAKGIINENSGRILPESFRIFSVPLDQNKIWLWPGKYRINISFRYEGGTEFQLVEISYIYFGKEGLILLTTLIIAGLFRWWWKRRV